ncbi:reverse transcriptase [Gossypium australe]|uniref:Reverse transcriptase n=1 Tax=Gossypium australe TaxID=47621 RepID=A0A5B6WI44_9ROSI|nr:reverse transcriptase [Gossypium australe]
MQHRTLVTDTSCPRCGKRAEAIDHLFRECLVTVEVWSTLLLQNVLIACNRDFEQWLTWVFEQLNTHECRIFSCALWAIWGDRNSRIHNKKEVTSAFAAEALACRRAVRIGMENTWPEVIVEGDSYAVIKKCNSKEQDKSMIGAYISDIQ